MNERILDEIPYIVNPRKDTGLFNSKIAIWLFLASEVMLFGGLFSGYIFLRIYADFPWPERTLPIVPGLLNTFILILSSVTVVFAWAALKLRKWNQFRMYMGVTIACAAVFMVFKVFEYKAKFAHQGVRMDDYAIVEGHVHKAKIDESGKIKHVDHHGDSHSDAEHKEEEAYYKGYQNKIIFKTESINFNLQTFYPGYVEQVIEQAKKGGSKLVFSEDVVVKTSPDSEAKVLAKAGEELSLSVLEQAKDAYSKARGSNSKARTAELRKLWKDSKAENPKLPNWKQAQSISIDATKLEGQLVETPGSLKVNVEPKLALLFKPTAIKADKNSAALKDGTNLNGTLKASPMYIGVDSIDFKFLVKKAKERGIDPDVAIEQSWILTNPKMRKLWEMKKKDIKELEARLLEEAGGDEEKAKEPTEIERYKITWKDIIHYTTGEKLSWFNGFTGASHEKYDFPSLEIPREKIKFESKFTPRWNNYYAIYFTITGLHGLHIIGGAIVLGYYMFCPNMFRANPEWLANRVEVAGLFWHFVDLVWIFLFPILYLM